MAELKKCIVIPDSFKGTMSAIDVCCIMEESIRRVFPGCQVKSIPAADGGEGTVDCFLRAMNGEKRRVLTTGPYGEPVEAYYAKLGDMAILEMAQVAGLPQVQGRLNPRRTTTYGLGEVIKAAIADGCRRITIGLGGSCTNDGGMGAARAMGVRFLNGAGEEFAPAADEMTQIAHIDISAAQKKLEGIEVTAMCDITNPMYGETGAAYVFGPQKGADEDCVRLLDQNLRALAEVIRRDLGVDVSQIPGAGAAGAFGAGIVAFFGGRLKSGIHTVLDITDFDRELEDAQLIFTGEGRVDAQSLQGKVLSGVAERAGKAGVPVVVVAGACEPEANQLYCHGVCGIFSTCRTAAGLDYQKAHSEENLAAAMEGILRLYAAV